MSRVYFTDIVTGGEMVTTDAADFDALRNANVVFRIALEEISQRLGESAHNPGLRAQRALDLDADREPDHPVASADGHSSAQSASEIQLAAAWNEGWTAGYTDRQREMGP